MSDAAWRSMRFGGGRGKKGHLGLLILVAWLITLLIAPILSRVLALAVSRKRELLADATGAQFTRNPAALASALLKIEHAHVPTKAIGQGSAHLLYRRSLGPAADAQGGLRGRPVGHASTHGPAGRLPQGNGLPVRKDRGLARDGLTSSCRLFRAIDVRQDDPTEFLVPRGDVSILQQQGGAPERRKTAEQFRIARSLQCFVFRGHAIPHGIA
ncbi:MAG: M48 family metalloprotease [Gemmatimonadetes bacterium]|nr:M48 family metalloprotease [Gemmatimonadota bacterium]